LLAKVPRNGGTCCSLFEQLEPLAAYCGLEIRESGEFAPGRARLATRPLPIGFATCKNTIGTAAVPWCNATAAGDRGCGREPSFEYSRRLGAISAALANAFSNAIDRRLREVPMTPERVKRLA
jgi:hypothetical protein